jgi:ABC-2 type transport system ATP-binding protein
LNCCGYGNAEIINSKKQMIKGIAVESVHKTFRQPGWFFSRGTAKTHALKGISFSVAPGEVLGLLGPNGSGKSTTLKLISTVLLPDRGRVAVNGADTRFQAQAVRRQVGFALASERSFFPRLTVRENLEFFAALEDVPWRECRGRVERVLGDVGLDSIAGKQAMRLSSGMYQRLAIARALIKQPSVLLLDEPTRSLDASASSQFWSLIRELSNSGMTILLATHNFAEAAAVCDRVAVLQEGRLMDIHAVNNSNSDQLRDSYLEITGETRLMEWPDGVPA